MSVYNLKKWTGQAHDSPEWTKPHTRYGTRAYQEKGRIRRRRGRVVWLHREIQGGSGGSGLRDVVRDKLSGSQPGG